MPQATLTLPTGGLNRATCPGRPPRAPRRSRGGTFVGDSLEETIHLAYVDDSGDSSTYVLGALLIPGEQWLPVQDQLIAFRSRLSQKQGFRMRYELHATEIIAGGGKWKALNVQVRTRFGIYKAALREVASLSPVARVIGVVVDSQNPHLRTSPREEAWDVLLQRLERFAFFEKSTCLLIHDEGGNRTVRTMARRKRRFGYAPAAFGGSGRHVPFKQLLDDPVSRDSRESYLLQWSDLVAYACFRKVVPRATVPSDLWDSLGDAPVSDANYIERSRGSNEPPGLVVWPGRRLLSTGT